MLLAGIDPSGGAKDSQVYMVELVKDFWQDLGFERDWWIADILVIEIPQFVNKGASKGTNDVWKEIASLVSQYQLQAPHRGARKGTGSIGTIWLVGAQDFSGPMFGRGKTTKQNHRAAVDRYNGSNKDLRLALLPAILAPLKYTEHDKAMAWCLCEWAKPYVKIFLKSGVVPPKVYVPRKGI